MNHIGLTRKEIEHLQTLIARLDAETPADAVDRRTFPRVDFCHALWLNLPTQAGQPWVHVYSRNLSTGGLSFLTRGLFYHQQHVVISHELNERTSVMALCRVCFCRAVELPIQEVGLAFVTALPDPGRDRAIPPEWHEIVRRNDWLARKTPRVFAE